MKTIRLTDDELELIDDGLKDLLGFLRNYDCEEIRQTNLELYVPVRSKIEKVKQLMSRLSK